MDSFRPARRSAILTALAPIVLAACGTSAAPPPTSEAPGAPGTGAVTTQPAEGVTPPLDRAQFNRLAAELYLPLFWQQDANNDGKPQAIELAVLTGMDDTTESDWVTQGAATPKLTEALAAIEKRHADGPPAGESPRHATLRRELNQGRPTLLLSNFATAPAEDREIVQHINKAAKLIEKIHAKQIGSWSLREQIPDGDTMAMAVFHRNQGPWCVAPETENDKSCNALPDAPAKISGLYPADIQKNPDFCEDLSKEKNAAALRDHFSVVQRDKGGALIGVPYHEAYKEEMTAIAAELEGAAEAITSKDEKAFQTYLRAAAKAFRDGSWQTADEAWAAMGVNNSKWYLRIGPDEVYFEPCGLKAGFHVSFARINQSSLAWQKKLDPKKNDMEQALAKLAGPPYVARNVSFKLPDFIDIVLNAGDARNAHGATIGQSLPNWGPVANTGRGRTVAMTNLYTDPDSRRDLREQASSLLCADTMKRFVDEAAPMTMSTVMHEAAHNLGPAHEYKVNGKTDDDIFGGPLASTLEELKAQSAALFLPGFLEKNNPGLIGTELVSQAHVRDIVWAFGHISRGMVTAKDQPKPYSQLAAIQLGWLHERRAVEWRPQETAANGEDTGCWSVKEGAAFEGPVEELMRTVAQIKGKGDLDGAKKLQAAYVTAAEPVKLMDVIRERWLRAPKATFVYSIDLE